MATATATATTTTTILANNPNRNGLPVINEFGYMDLCMAISTRRYIATDTNGFIAAPQQVGKVENEGAKGIIIVTWQSGEKTCYRVSISYPHNQL